MITKDIELAISNKAGPDVLPVFKLLHDNKSITEERIAEELKQEINSTRNLLYKLQNFNIASYTKKRDPINGWYIYYWNYNSNRTKDILNKFKKKNENHESIKDGYMCSNKCMQISQENAIDIGFRCPECGELLNSN